MLLATTKVASTGPILRLDSDIALATPGVGLPAWRPPMACRRTVGLCVGLAASMTASRVEARLRGFPPRRLLHRHAGRRAGVGIEQEQATAVEAGRQDHAFADAET